MVAAKRDEVTERRCLLLNESETLWDVAESNAEVADVCHSQCRRVDPPVGVVAVHQHSARLPDRSGSEARAAAIGGA